MIYLLSASDQQTTRVELTYLGSENEIYVLKPRIRSRSETIKQGKL